MYPCWVQVNENNECAVVIRIILYGWKKLKPRNEKRGQPGRSDVLFPRIYIIQIVCKYYSHVRLLALQLVTCL